jgi:DIM1 family U5 snRNP protein
MGSIVLPHLRTAWHVDQAILSEEERLVVIRFGRDHDPDCKSPLSASAPDRKNKEHSLTRPLHAGIRQDELLYKIAERVKSPSSTASLPTRNKTDPVCDAADFSVIYLCDVDEVPDFNTMYELYDPMTIMFFYRNKHMMCDFGTGNNNKLNWVLEDKQELIDIIETIYKGAKKGRGLVISPKGKRFCVCPV